MTPGVFKNRYMVRRNFFKNMKKEPFESFETLEETYELPEVFDYEIKDAISNALSKLTPREQLAIKGRYFENLTLGQIGWSFGQLEGDYGVSQERARQILSKALRKLKHPSLGLKEVA
jgi:RNA polymerase sigma factor (sigma-70 family)|tara:strand:- start:16 stop:369 length:354 start_codon:yes stop_codon:yes gene_type:complete